jgi:hypothetical protein
MGFIIDNRWEFGPGYQFVLVHFPKVESANHTRIKRWSISFSRSTLLYRLAIYSCDYPIGTPSVPAEHPGCGVVASEETL